MEHVLLKCDTSGPDAQSFCSSGYVIDVCRKDGKSLSEVEMRSIITQTIESIEGEKSFVTVTRD